MLHDSVIEKWGSEIVSGALPSGYRIGAENAARNYGVSRTVVREAVRVLESMGLLTVKQRIGITVAPPANWNALDPNIFRWRIAGPDAGLHLSDLAELRTVIEPWAARRAASFATIDQVSALTPAVIGMATTGRSGDLSGYLQFDADFHRTLLAASGNPLLVGLAELVGEAIVSPAARDPHLPCTGSPGTQIPSGSTTLMMSPGMITLHGTVAAAIESGDSNAAEDAVRAIFVPSPVTISHLHDPDSEGQP